MEDNGGDSNAATGEDYTYFYFDVAEKKFPEATDIFSQFFKEPLFNPESMDREMKAIDSEYQMHISDEPVATDQLEKSDIAAPGSIVNRFLIGNLQTLKVDGVYNQLKSYYKNNYSSNRMNLVLVGKQSLDELQKLAEDNFKDVKNQNLTAQSYKNETVFTKEHSFGRIYKVIPNKELSQISLKWQLPSSSKEWRQKSSDYLAQLFGNEGPNSL